MKPASFDYVKPETLKHAAALLAAHGDDAKILAGGQTLVPMMNFRLVTPAVLIDINDVQGLNVIEQQDDHLRLGALVRWHEIQSSSLIARFHPLLAEAVNHIAHYQIRNRGTWAGSCAHADPAAEFPAIALISDAKFSLMSAQGQRVISAADFFVGPLATDLRADEILASVDIPIIDSGSRWAFEEFALRTGDFAIAGIAVLILPENQDDRVRCVAFGVGDKARRLPTAEAILTGSDMGRAAIREAAASIGADLEVRADIHASAEYRTALTTVLLERALERALGSSRPL
jgi:carbon-monoxide dehydrogenase medium subunit